jgi:transposase
MPGLRSWRRRSTSIMAAPRKYPDELRERAIREVRATGRPVAHVARDLGIHPEALRGWVRQAEARRPRHCPRQGEKGGGHTGPSPVDRGKPGSKMPILSDANGLPLVVGVSAALRRARRPRPAGPPFALRRTAAPAGPAERGRPWPGRGRARRRPTPSRAAWPSGDRVRTRRRLPAGSPYHGLGEQWNSDWR